MHSKNYWNFRSVTNIISFNKNTQCIPHSLIKLVRHFIAFSVFLKFGADWTCHVAVFCFFLSFCKTNRTKERKKSTRTHPSRSPGGTEQFCLRPLGVPRLRGSLCLVQDKLSSHRATRDLLPRVPRCQGAGAATIGTKRGWCGVRVGGVWHLRMMVSLG